MARSSNLYADLTSFKRQLLSTSAFVDSAESDVDDAMYLTYLELASRDIDNLVGGTENWRHFYVDTGTRYFYTEDERPLSGFPYAHGQQSRGIPLSVPYKRDYRLLIPDLLSLDSIEFDGVDSGLTADEYDLFPLNAFPKIELVMRRVPFPRSARIGITGRWGYEDTRMPVRWFTASTRDANASDALFSGSASGWIGEATTELRGLNANALISSGSTIWLDDEQVYASYVSGDGVATIQRGVNGTTAAAHYFEAGRHYIDGSTGATSNAQSHTAVVSALQKFPATIFQSCIDLALKKYRGRETEWEGSGADVENFTDILTPIAPQILHYRRGYMLATLL